MKPCEVIVSVSAAEDLEAGREFYDAIDDGLGSYFIESLLSTLNLSNYTPAFIANSMAFIVTHRNVFPFRFTTSSAVKKPESLPF